MSGMLKAENVTVRYGARTVVQDLSFELKEGEWLMLVLSLIHIYTSGEADRRQESGAPFSPLAGASSDKTVLRLHR